MVNPNIPKQAEIIKNEDIQQEDEYQGLRIIRCQTDQKANENFMQRRYQFQYELADRTEFRCVLSRKGAPTGYRLVATVHPSMKLFVDAVKYDPANPPLDDYNAQGMREAHERTQSDFKGQKQANTRDFTNYILEGIQGNRVLYLPTITAWQSKKVFDKTIFVAFDETDPNAMYGLIYLPKAPIMQADGQTQTAAIFQTAKTIDAIAAGALESLILTLEIELNLVERQAGQSFADRNGRGSKKNKNLVINLDSSSPLSSLRVQAIEGTVFEFRLADGRTTGTTETATKHIVDLSTMEQMLLNVIAKGNRKPEHFKHHYVKQFLPYCQEFLELLSDLFSSSWAEVTPEGKAPFRQLYVHGWPFCLKALALAYYQSRIDILGPLSAAIGTENEDKDASKTLEEKYMSQVEKKRGEFTEKPVITFEEFKKRLEKIDWHRHRKHWIALTGYKLDKGVKKTITLKGSDIKVVAAQAQNTAAVIGAVCDKILSDSWQDLCSDENEPLN
jgi:hypothetical protein